MNAELEKEAEEYDLVIRFKSNKPKYEIRDYIINHTLNEFDDLQMWDFKRSSEFAEPREKRVAELEQKISVLLSCKNCPENKDGYICAKEYENKCLAQKIQYIKELQQENAELKARLNAINQLIPELEKENAELKGQAEMSYEVYNDNLDYSYHIEGQLTEAKEIINNCVHELQIILLHKIRNKERIASILDKTEQFLKESKYDRV